MHPGVVAVLCESIGTEKVICLAWDLVSRTHITLYFGEKVEKKQKTKTKTFTAQGYYYVCRNIDH